MSAVAGKDCVAVVLFSVSVVGYPSPLRVIPAKAGILKWRYLIQKDPHPNLLPVGEGAKISVRFAVPTNPDMERHERVFLL